MDRDQDTSSVYAAQDDAMEFFQGHGTTADPWMPLEPEQETQDFVRETLDTMGEVHREIPIFEFGPIEPPGLAGRYDFERDVIELDTTELNR